MKDKEVIQLKGKIFIYYSNKGLVFRYPTGIDPRQQNIPENQNIIQSLVKKQRDIIYQYRLENGTNPSREYLKAKMKDEILTANASLMDFYKEFLTFKNKEVKNGNLKPQSLTDYNNLRGSLTGFEKTYRNQLRLTNVTEDMVNRFKTYLINKRGMNNNSVKKRLKSFKIFLNYCIERKYMKLNFDYSRVKIKTYDPTIVTLMEEEFKKLKAWDAGKYVKVKDLFLFGCLTSLRYSDLVSIREHHIINNNIVKKSEKTDIQQIIPLTRLSREILERYNFNLDFYRTQTYNRLLKKMGQASGLFDSEVVLVEQRGNQRLEIRKQKWECLESHTARRTFITRSITKGIPLNIIMGITGHTRIETLSRYMDKYTPTNGYRELLEE
jgi:site-specific recombinase XerD